MRFKDWLVESGTSTGDIAGFSRITLPLVTRQWPTEVTFMYKNKEEKKKKTKQQPQVQESSNYDYSCVLYDLNKEDSKEIMDWSKKNIPDDKLNKDGEKGREDKPHVTILYGLHGNNPDKVIDLIKGFKSGEIISFGEISKFELEKCDVIKISVSGSILRKMNKELKSLPYTSNHPVYSPHCTLAYVNKNSCDHLLGKKVFAGLKSKIDSVTYSPANGKRVKIDLT